MLNLDKIQEEIKKRQEEHDRIWNAAIEACFETIAIRNPISQDAFEAVRKLKI